MPLPNAVKVTQRPQFLKQCSRWWLPSSTFAMDTGTNIPSDNQYIHQNGETIYANPIVVSDGYLQETTKTVTHQRRGQSSAKVRIDLDLPLKMDKKVFLQNKSNKQAFINLLSDEMREQNITTFRAEDDTDLLIVQVAVNMAKYKTTFVIAEDTDVLVLLCHHHKPGS